jgi:ATP-dependent helicase/DNAse subunit B
MYDEERRLFYVAMTRAKENLTITSSISQLSKPDGKVIDYLHFIDDISLDRILIEESRNFESDKGDDILFLNLDTKSQQYANNEENEFLLSKLKNLRFSATTLTSYLKCGYKYKLDYLVKIPQKKSVIIGLQVHNALDKFYKEYKSTSKLPESTRLVEYFKQELNLLPISEMRKIKFSKTGNIY